MHVREFSSNEPQKILNIISTLTDNTRLEILSLLMQNPEGLTASNISSHIDKKIPSTIYQLEIIQASGLIRSEMKKVESIGRDIKHWILPVENYHFMFEVNLRLLIYESTLSIEVRNAYLNQLQKQKSVISSADLEKFDPDILKSVILPNGAMLTEKDITKILQLKEPFDLLIDTFIFRIRGIISNLTVNEPFSGYILKQMFGISDELAMKIFSEVNTHMDMWYDYQDDNVYRKE